MNKILQEYLPKDIVQHIIIPYMTISKEEIHRRRRLSYYALLKHLFYNVAVFGIECGICNISMKKNSYHNHLLTNKHHRNVLAMKG